MLKPCAMLLPCLLTVLVALPNVGVAEAAATHRLEARLWARATLPGMRTAAVYGSLRNDSDAMLIAASPASQLAEHASLHETRRDQATGMHRMRHLEELHLPAGASVALAPGGLHLMLFGLAARLRQGETLPLSLEVRGANGTGRLQLEVPVLAPGALQDEAARLLNPYREN